jgi:palmitoyltransferase ZDHHC1/11
VCACCTNNKIDFLLRQFSLADGYSVVNNKFQPQLDLGLAGQRTDYWSLGACMAPRKNGWNWPPHPLQCLAWLFVLLFPVLVNGVIAPVVSQRWQPAVYFVFGSLHIITTLCLILATTIDPADPNVRLAPAKRPTHLDRSVRAKVIENSKCYFCQVKVGSRSKHCRVCDKCTSDFDHHCNYFNSCVGGRTYR